MRITGSRTASALVSLSPLSPSWPSLTHLPRTSRSTRRAGGGKRAYNKKSAHWDNAKVPKNTFTPIGHRGPNPGPGTPHQTEKQLALEAQVELEQKEKEVWKER